MLKKKNLILFLQKLIDGMKNNTLDDNGIKQISEFYMSWQFKEDQGEYTREELIKYLSLGWYIYTNLLTEEIN